MTDERRASEGAAGERRASERRERGQRRAPGERRSSDPHDAGDASDPRKTGLPQTGTPRDAGEPAVRAADHDAIDRLAGALLPALVAKLGATGLGEIEVREGDWKIRLRRPADAAPGTRRSAADRPSRAQPGHAGHGHPPAALETHVSARLAATNGSRPPFAAVGPGTGRPEEPSSEPRPVATSPAVGIYQPRPDLRAGTRVRAGDRLGFVDMLGVPQEVVAPVDGIVGLSLAEAGEPVEYGQELVPVEPVAGGEG